MRRTADPSVRQAAVGPGAMGHAAAVMRRRASADQTGAVAHRGLLPLEAYAVAAARLAIAAGLMHVGGGQRLELAGLVRLDPFVLGRGAGSRVSRGGHRQPRQAAWSCRDVRTGLRIASLARTSFNAPGRRFRRAGSGLCRVGVFGRAAFGRTGPLGLARALERGVGAEADQRCDAPGSAPALHFSLVVAIRADSSGTGREGKGRRSRRARRFPGTGPPLGPLAPSACSPGMHSVAQCVPSSPKQQAVAVGAQSASDQQFIGRALGGHPAALGAHPAPNAPSAARYPAQQRCVRALHSTSPHRSFRSGV